MLLTTTSAKYEVLLSAAVTTTELSLYSTWVDNTSTGYTPGNTSTVSNGVSAVAIVPSPAASTQRVVRDIHILNRDSNNVTITVRYNDGSTTFNMLVVQLNTNDTLIWSPKRGWYVIDNHGIIRTNLTTANQTGACRFGHGQNGTTGANKTLTSNSTYATYLGRADTDFSRIIVRFNIVTAAAVITWVEIGVATGTPVLNGNASLSLLKYMAADTILNSTGNKKMVIEASGSAGTDLWFLMGAQATTALVITSHLQDDLQAGFNQVASSTRPSTMADPTSFTIESATTAGTYLSYQLQ